MFEEIKQQIYPSLGTSMRTVNSTIGPLKLLKIYLPRRVQVRSFENDDNNPNLDRSSGNENTVREL